MHLYVDGAAMEVLANQPRPDVAAAFPLYRKAPHGFTAVLGAGPGRHKVCAYAINMSGTGFNALLGCKWVTVPTPSVSAPAAVASSSTSSAPTTSSTPSTSTSTTSTTRTTVAQGSPTSNR